MMKRQPVAGSRSCCRTAPPVWRWNGWVRRPTDVKRLKFLAQRPADVVLLDIRMPGMDGIEAAQHIQRLPQPPAVIFVTAYDHYAIQAFEVNAIDYLLKPVRAERLLAALLKATARGTGTWRRCAHLRRKAGCI